MRNNRINRKSIVGIFAILLLLLTIFSSVYIIVESEHKCEGEGCPICHMIEVCEEILYSIGNTLSFCVTVAFMSSISKFLLSFKSNNSFRRTLFDLKVRLNN